MHTYIYIYIHIYMYVCMYVCIRTYIHGERESLAPHDRAVGDLYLWVSHLQETVDTLGVKPCYYLGAQA